MTFSNALKRLREESGMTQDELAAAMNARYDTKLNRSTISRWENDLQEASMNHVRLMADYFGVSLDAINGTEEIEPQQESPQLTVLFSRSRRLSDSQLEAVNRIVAEMVKEEQPYDD